MRLCLALLLVACADPAGRDPAHDLTACSAAWGSAAPTMCEPACVTPPAYAGLDCRARNPAAPSNVVRCEEGTFEYEGLVGCCKPWATGEPGESYARFFICD